MRSGTVVMGQASLWAVMLSKVAFTPFSIYKDRDGVNEIFLVSAKGLASRYAALKDGEGRRRRRRANGGEMQQNIQLAIFTDRSCIPPLVSTAVRAKAAEWVIFLKLCAAHISGPSSTMFVSDIPTSLLPE